MRPLFALLLAPTLLAGCAVEDPAMESAAASVAVGQQVSCIDVNRVAGRRAPDNRTLEFEMTTGETFRNDLQETCLGIERASNFGTLNIDPIEARLCRNDMVRVYDPADVNNVKTAPRCRLGTFTRVERQPR